MGAQSALRKSTPRGPVYVTRANLAPNARDYGAIGDGISRPLSTLFGSLAAARATFPAAVALTDELDWAAIASAIAAHGGCYLPKTASRYVINRTLDITVGGWLLGDPGKSQVYMTANNLPIVSMGNGSGSLQHLRLTYSRQQTSAETNSNGVYISRLQNGSLLKQIRVEYAARGIYNDPAGYVYSTSFEDLTISYYSISALDIHNGGGITGNVIKNLYTHNNPGGTVTPSTAQPVYIGGWDDGVLEQINIEWTKSPGAFATNQCYNLTVQSMHIEGFQMSGDYNGLLSSFSGSDRTTINGLSVINCQWNTADIPSGVSALYKVSNGSRIWINGFSARGNSSSINSLGLVYGAGVGATGFARLRLDSVYSRDVFTVDSNGDSPRLPILAQYDFGATYAAHYNGSVTLEGTAAPAVGTWALGDEIRNTAPAEVGTAGSKYVTSGWICVAAGTPGTWVPKRVLTGN